MRPRRRRFGSSTRGSKRIDRSIKSGTTGMVRIGGLQSFHGAFIIEKICVSLGDSKTNDHRPSMTSIYVLRQGKHHVPMIASSRLCHDVSAEGDEMGHRTIGVWLTGILSTVFECLVLLDLPSTPAGCCHSTCQMRCDKPSRVNNMT